MTTILWQRDSEASPKCYADSHAVACSPSKMLTVMCPNCRHHFPANGCCAPSPVPQLAPPPPTCYLGGILVPKGYTSGGDCFISQETQENPHKSKAPVHQKLPSQKSPSNPQENCQITTSCDLTGGSVTITTPGIQSGGCLIQGSDSGVLEKSQNVLQIFPKFSGGSCFVQENQGVLGTRYEEALDSNNGRMLLLPPSGCQELPGSRKSVQKPTNQETIDRNFENRPILSSIHVTSVPVLPLEDSTANHDAEPPNCTCKGVQSPKSLLGVENSPIGGEKLDQGLQIQVNATLQLPARLRQCTVNITASASPPLVQSYTNGRTVNNFNGGGLVESDSNDVRREEEEENDFGRREGSPTTPVSWLMPCPWGFDSYLVGKDVARLGEAKRALQGCGWYHEGISWQQSEALLKNAPVGRWLMRDSSDSRYTFAVSVQTSRGPTSVRVHHFLGRFRLDAEPRLAFAMPLFDCPIKMLEYYVEYSKSVDEHRKEVWVDYSGQLYSEIYLTKPLLKEVRPLSHLARLEVHRHKLNVEHLPGIIRNFVQEYPYTL